MATVGGSQVSGPGVWKVLSGKGKVMKGDCGVTHINNYPKYEVIVGFNPPGGPFAMEPRFTCIFVKDYYTFW